MAKDKSFDDVTGQAANSENDVDINRNNLPNLFYQSVINTLKPAMKMTI